MREHSARCCVGLAKCIGNPYPPRLGMMGDTGIFGMLGAITACSPSLTLEQVYATITYYLHNREAIRAYLAAWREDARPTMQHGGHARTGCR